MSHLANTSRTDTIERARKQASKALPQLSRELNGQFLTPAAIADFMASMVHCHEEKSIRFLEPGAGVGSLIFAFASQLCSRDTRPKSLHAVAYEIEPLFQNELKSTLGMCQAMCREAGIAFTSELRHTDFLSDSCKCFESDLFDSHSEEAYDLVIMNPPYKKIAQDSRERALVRRTGIKVGNLYSAFVTMAIQLLKEGGQLVAITPRSFCNGPYFRDFRQFLLENIRLDRIHEFDSRNDAFKDDSVLQETIIFSGRKSRNKSGSVLVTSSPRSDLRELQSRMSGREEIVHPADKNMFIHLPSPSPSGELAKRVRSFAATLEDLGLAVSTGRVVDFRAKQHLRKTADTTCAPLIYPLHLRDGSVRWPVLGAKKPNGLVVCDETEVLLVPAERYVLVKRFTSKEERKRITATVFEPSDVPFRAVALENHLNYFHMNHRGIPERLAWGLAAYLNSSLIDSFFRQFNGHTQVNATDLRSLKYPSKDQLVEIGGRAGIRSVSQQELDDIVQSVIDFHA